MGRPPGPPRPGGASGAKPGAPVDGEASKRLDKFEEDLGKLLGEVGELRSAIRGGLANLSGRIDEVHEEIDGEVRGKLDSISSEVEDSAAHVLEKIEAEADERAKLAILVGKLRRERAGRKEAERTSIRVKAEADASAQAAKAEVAAAEGRSKAARAQLVAALLTAIAVAGMAFADRLATRLGASPPATTVAEGGTR